MGKKGDPKKGFGGRETSQLGPYGQGGRGPREEKNHKACVEGENRGRGKKKPGKGKSLLLVAFRLGKGDRKRGTDCSGRQKTIRENKTLGGR